MTFKLEEIMNRLDTLFSENKGNEAQTLLENSIYEAMEEENDEVLLPLLNEMIGYKRETSQTEDSFRYADMARALMKKMGIEGSTAYATTLLNIANAYRAGGRLEDSLSCYTEVLTLYEKQVDQKDMLFASLYNNLSLLYQEMGDFKKAKEYLLLALGIVRENKEVYFEEAVTYANLAATCLKLNEDEEAVCYFEKAVSIFAAHGIADAHYAAAVSSMGTYLFKKAEYKKAAECFEKAMAAMKASLGENEYYHRLSENLAACRQALEAENGSPQINGSPEITGLQLCREFYETYGEPMIKEQFPDYADKIAAGLCGEGSDCFGYDDAVSRDHDWGPGFCLFVSEKVNEEIGDKLKEAYEKLPKEFMGYQRKTSRQGEGRVGVCTVTGFFERILGKDNCHNLTKSVTTGDFEWTNIQDWALAAAVNGEIFTDPEGTLSAVRAVLQAGYPKRLQYLKIAESCARFSQELQYNYGRMHGRGDAVAAGLSLAEGLRQAMKLLYYMDGKYPPHDKWLYRGISGLKDSADISSLLVKLAKEGDGSNVSGFATQLGSLLADRLYELDFISDREEYLEYHCTELLEKAAFAEKSKEELAELIAEEEFEAFDKVRNTGGRASCQNDWYTFSIMRRSQYLTWNQTMLLQYLFDFKLAESQGRNLIEEKYGRMMESTAPLEYEKIAGHFPKIPQEKRQIIEAIVQLQVGFMEEFAARFPYLASNARTIHTTDDRPDDTSYETYLRGEISTYSDKMLMLYGRFVAGLAAEGKNLARMTMENSAHLYGYEDLEAAEAFYSR